MKAASERSAQSAPIGFNLAGLHSRCSYTELQAGSYVFRDDEYARILGKDGEPFRDFRHSLFIFTTVMSSQGRSWAVCDAGAMAASADRGMPKVVGDLGPVYVKQSDEHGVLATPSHLKLGTRLRLIPSHCDPTVNLHDWFVCYRGDRDESPWPITARGHLY